MMESNWNYDGDVNLAYGGTYWREDGADDYVLAVRVTPCSDAGGPDNKWHIESGSIYMPTDRAAPLDIIGVEPANATRRDLVSAWLAYSGIDRYTWNGETVVTIGRNAADDCRGWNPDTDVRLHGNASLARYVAREFLD